jgi:hypothetical protein
MSTIYRRRTPRLNDSGQVVGFIGGYASPPTAWRHPV